MVAALVGHLQWRIRLASILAGAAAGLAALAMVTVVANVAFRASVLSVAAGALAGLVTMAVVLARARARWTPEVSAALAESRTPGLDNLLITAVQLAGRPDGATARLRAEVERQALARAARIEPAKVQPVWPAAVIFGLVLSGTAALVWSVALQPTGGRADRSNPATASGIAHVRVVTTPPAYLDAPPARHDDPVHVTVVAGTRLRVVVGTDAPLAWMAVAGSSTRRMEPVGDGIFAVEWTPVESEAVVLAAGADPGHADDSRLLAVTVEPDAPPRPRVVTPARDLAVPVPPASIDVTIEAEDAEGLRALELRFVRLAGSGEAFTFAEGRVPVTVERVSPTLWRAQATWALSALRLEDGDALIYRAAARDGNPNGEWVSSDPLAIEIGRHHESLGAGSALPDEERRYAVSQQMVIAKTERLQASRPRPVSAEWMDEARLVAIEQRMVRSEVVFLSGGEIEDEVEEAAHSHELQEGRLENLGRAEMIRAINEMSRAEARLNAGDTAGALRFERAALAALQRAFDRRRYFLRTLPERARIDPARRLSGERRDARTSMPVPATGAGDPALAAERAAMNALAEVVRTGVLPASATLARLLALDPPSGEWRGAMSALVTAAGSETRISAAQTAMQLVAARARATLVPPPAALPATADDASLTGLWADELRKRGPR